MLLLHDNRASGSDPFDEILKPPPNETPAEKLARMEREEKARRVSLSIDEEIRAEIQRKKKMKVIRLLLLGQSESGKSTTLRQFQRLYTPTAFREERILWRAVIQFNILRSVRLIMDTIIQSQRETVGSGDESNSEDSAFSPELEALIVRLLPLKHAESLLRAKLVPPNDDEPTDLDDAYSGATAHDREIFVRPGAKWKGALTKAPSTSGLPSSFSSARLEATDKPQELLHMCRLDIANIWNDQTVRDILRRRKMRIEESPGFYLDDIERVTSLHYVPTDEDVLKARLKTIGVSEYTFEMEAAAGRDSGTIWRIIDVGGSRSQRPMWIPFFDDVHAIIFLAPISGFDQVLVEDRTVNRLEDSVLLWKAICANKLLANVDLVLFLNKCDIMDKKLKSGIKLAKYIRSYGDRPNDLENASKYLKSKFSAIQREHSPHPRKFYAFCTSVTDSTTTAGILISVRDMVIRQNLQKSRLL